MMVKKFLVLIFFILSAFAISYAQNFAKGTQAFEYVYYIDTIRIDNPLIVKIDGIGFLTEGKYFDAENPKSSLEDLSTYATNYSFHDHELYIAGMDVMFHLTSKELGRYLYASYDGPLTSEFYYSHTKKGCEVYRCRLNSIVAYVFLVQNAFFTGMVNVDDEYTETRYIRKGINLGAKYNELEYLRVATPVKLKSKKEENE